MSSDDPNAIPDQELPEDLVQDRETPDDFRRRSRTRTVILTLAAIIVVAVLGYLLYRNVSPETILDIAAEYWPVSLAPIIGWLLGYWAVHSLYHPTASYYGCLDPVTHEFTLVRIPDEMIRYFDQPGNSVQYHTPLSNRYYPVQDMDLRSGRIAYAWPMDADPQLLFSREESYLKWSTWVLDVAKENVQLRDNPLLMAILLTRNHLGKTLDGIAKMLNMDDPDPTTRDYSMGDIMDAIHSRSDDNDPDDQGGEIDDRFRQHSGRLRLIYGARGDHRSGLGQTGEIMLPAQPAGLLPSRPSQVPAGHPAVRCVRLPGVHPRLRDEGHPCRIHRGRRGCQQDLPVQGLRQERRPPGLAVDHIA